MILKEIVIVIGVRGIILMNNLLALFLIVVFFILGFWLGVHAKLDQRRRI